MGFSIIMVICDTQKSTLFTLNLKRDKYATEASKRYKNKKTQVWTRSYIELSDLITF